MGRAFATWHGTLGGRRGARDGAPMLRSESGSRSDPATQIAHYRASGRCVDVV